MAIFLKILAVTGIVLLSILAFILLVICLVLFVPVRYNAKGKYQENNLSFTAKVTWLLGIVGIKYTFGDENPLSIRIFFFQLNKKKKEKPTKVKKTKKTKKKVKEEIVSEKEVTPQTEEPSSEIEIIDATKLPESETIVANYEDANDKDIILEEDISEAVPDNDDVVAYDSISEGKKDKSKQKKAKDKDNTKPSVYDKIKKYIEIIKSDRFKKTYPYCKKKLGKLLKHVLPRKWDLNVLIGFDDPSTTGNILVYTSMLYPFIAKHIHIKGDFEKEIIYADLKLKGHITAFKILIIGIQVYFNKNIRKLIKLFKEV